MSEYQYYEFCRLSSPLSSEARKDMHSLSSRARVGSHTASYVYNYGDFPGDPTKLLLKYFDAFFYIANWVTVQLMFKYSEHQVRISEIKKYCINYLIACEHDGQHVIVDIRLCDEEGGNWIDGEGLLPDLLPLYDEIKANNYQFLHLVSAIHDEMSGKNDKPLTLAIRDPKSLTSAQEAFLHCIDYVRGYSFS